MWAQGHRAHPSSKARSRSNLQQVCSHLAHEGWGWGGFFMYLVKEELLYLMGAYILVTSVLNGSIHIGVELTYWCGAYILVRASLYGLQRYYLQRRMMFGVCVLGIKE